MVPELSVSPAWRTKSSRSQHPPPPPPSYPSSSSTAAPPLGSVGSSSIDDSGGTDGDEGRGIHVLVLNEYDGYVMSKRVFDTYSPNKDEELNFYLNMIRDGRILVFAVQDEASFKMPLNSPTRALLQRLGSKRIMELKWRDMWALVVRKSTLAETDNRLGESMQKKVHENAMQMNIVEGLTKSPRFADWGSALFLEAKIELIEPRYRLPNNLGYDCQWTEGHAEEIRRRADFCSRVEGYGRVCDCNYPAPISFTWKQVSHGVMQHTTAQNSIFLSGPVTTAQKIDYNRHGHDDGGKQR